MCVAWLLVSPLPLPVLPLLVLLLLLLVLLLLLLVLQLLVLLLLLLVLLKDASGFLLLLLSLRDCVTVAISVARVASTVVFLAFLAFLVSYGDAGLVFSIFFCCLWFPDMLLRLVVVALIVCEAERGLSWS